MEDVVITDAGDPQAKRTTYADQGTMAFNETQTDLFLTLNNGVVLEVPGNRPGAFQIAAFQEQFLPIRGIANMLERGLGGERRSDREMSTTMLADSAKGAEIRSQEFLEGIRDESLYAVKRALGWQIVGDSLAPPGSTPVTSEVEFDDEEYASGPIPPDELTTGAFLNARTGAQQARFLELDAVEKMVEVHKKYSISFACIVFVLLGAPLAVRFPRGGVGMVVTASVVIFALFWASLIGGETLADDGYVSPALAMWLPNLILLPLGVYLVTRISSQVATARAGGWDDLVFTILSLLKKPLSRNPLEEGK
jgi:lipopolysaccharide export system permease protein